VYSEEIEDGGERTVEKGVPEALSDLAESVSGFTTNIFAAGGFTEMRGEGIPSGSRETAQQR